MIKTLILSRIISTDLIPSELSALCLVAAMPNWVARCDATQFAVTATNHSSHSVQIK